MRCPKANAAGGNSARHPCVVIVVPTLRILPQRAGTFLVYDNHKEIQAAVPLRELESGKEPCAMRRAKHEASK